MVNVYYKDESIFVNGIEHYKRNAVGFDCTVEFHEKDGRIVLKSIAKHQEEHKVKTLNVHIYNANFLLTRIEVFSYSEGEFGKLNLAMNVSVKGYGENIEQGEKAVIYTMTRNSASQNSCGRAQSRYSYSEYSKEQSTEYEILLKAVSHVKSLDIVRYRILEHRLNKTLKEIGYEPIKQAEARVA